MQANKEANKAQRLIWYPPRCMNEETRPLSGGRRARPGQIADAVPQSVNVLNLLSNLSLQIYGLFQKSADVLCMGPFLQGLLLLQKHF